VGASICHQQLGDYSKAIEYLRRALNADPRNAIAYQLIGYSYLRQGNTFEALAAYTKATALEPNSPSLWGTVGECYEKLGIPDQAIQAYNQVLALKPDEPLSLVRLASIYSTASDAYVRDGKRAVNLADRACKLTQYREPLCLSTLAAAYAECGDFQKAIEYQVMALDVLRRQEYGGIGVAVLKVDHVFRITHIVPTAPAASVDIHVGDTIAAVDGQSVQDMQLPDVVDRLKGAPGTKVTLTLKRADQQAPEDVCITRHTIHNRELAEFRNRLAAYEAGIPWRSTPPE